MKFLSLIAFPLLLGFASHKDDKAPKKVFYFCDSKTISPEKLTGKIYISYTGIQELENDSALIWKRTREWSAVTKKGCETNRCTADLNFYFTHEDAQKQLRNTLQGYADTGKYTVTKLDF